MLIRKRTLLVLALLAPAPALGQLCDGDCANDGAVTVDEIVTGVNLALGVAPLAQCNPFDRDASGGVTVDEVIAAINNALSGCPDAPAQSLFGVAATGAATVGQVCAVAGDGSNAGCSATAVDGSFRIDTSGAPAPFILRALSTLGDGQPQFSWSDANDGLINVTPFTTLALLLATDYDDLPQLYADWLTGQSSVDPEILTDAVDAMLDNFAAELAGAVDAGFDPFTSFFAANGSGFDSVLDGLAFNFDFANGLVFLNGSGLEIDFDPNTFPDGNFRLTISLSIPPAPPQQVASIDNVPKPADQSQFCVPELFDDAFTGLGAYTVTSCTFDGSVGRISANVSVPGFTLSYTAVYTYTPL